MWEFVYYVLKKKEKPMKTVGGISIIIEHVVLRL
jgi:hypothetical protein